MNKVISVNLNTRAYQLEEGGYAALKKYLDGAARQLADDPDRDEIVADFEQAIAEKCDQVLTNGKTVVSEVEIKNIITEMGPVNLDQEADAARPAANQLKRFYLIKDGAIIGGVCNGLATYFNIDVTVVRLLVVLLIFLSGGAAVAAYLIVMFVAPEAVTPEEKAAARGRRFNSQELLETARQKYAVLGDKKHWEQVAKDSRPILGRLGQVIRNTLRFLSGLIALGGFLSLLGILVVGVSGIWSLVISGQIFGLVIDSKVSTSLIALFVAAGLMVVAVPIFIITTTAYKYAKASTLRQSPWGPIAALCVFAVAVGVCLTILSATPELRTLSTHWRHNGNSYDRVICVGECPNSPAPAQAHKIVPPPIDGRPVVN